MSDYKMMREQNSHIETHTIQRLCMKHALHHFIRSFDAEKEGVGILNRRTCINFFFALILPRLCG
jgi:hypothetical protein